MAPPTYNFLKSEVKRLTAELAAERDVTRQQSSLSIPRDEPSRLTSDTPPLDAIPSEAYRHAASAGEIDGHDPSDPEPDFDCRLGYVDLVTRQPADIEAWRSRRDARIKERSQKNA